MKKTAFLLLALLLGGPFAGAREKVERYDDSARPVIAPRGTWLVGGNASFSGHRNDNYDFAAIKGINSVGFHLAVAPEVCYFFNDNLGAGVKVGYGRRMLDAESGAAELSGLALGVNNYYTLSHDISTMAYLRYYLPIADSKRLAFHLDTGLEGVWGQSRRSDEHTGAEVGTWETNYQANLLLNPGVTAFLSRRTAIYATVGMVGLTYGRTEQTHNQVTSGTANAYSLRYLVDLTALHFGINLYFGK